MSSSIRWIMTALLAITSAAAHGQAQSPDSQSPESIRAAAESSVSAQLPQTKGKYFVTAARLDPRLRLAPCASQLEAAPVNGSLTSAKSTIGVRCPSPAWSIYVAVTVEVEAQILVLKRPLSRRSPVDPADVELQTRRLPGIASAFISETSVLTGRRLRRALPAGTPLTADVLAPDVLVHRGQQVTLLASNGPFEIRAQGQAMSDGSENQRIRVQNVTSRKIVEGVVEDSATVRVDL